MKLLLLSTSSSRNAGGLYNSVRNLGQALLHKKKIDPVVLAFTDTHTKSDLAAYDPLPIELYSIIGPSGLALSFNLKKKIESIKPDIIHVQGIYLFSSYINLKYSSKNRVPYIISPRGMLDKWILNTRPMRKKIGFFLYESSHLKNASCIHALAESEYQSIRNFGLTNPVAVVPNGVFLPQERSNYQKPTWQKDNRKVMLFLSRLHPKKGIENLMQAWASVPEIHTKWKIIIAGESAAPDYTTSLKNLQTSLSLENDIFFVGPQFHDEKDIAFREASAFILPSYSEGMPMAILEAWSYQLPVIMTDECNIPEGFARNAAMRVEATPASIVETLKKLLSFTDEQLNEIGINGYQLVKDKYTWESIGEEMTNIYMWIHDKTLPVPKSVRIN